MNLQPIRSEQSEGCSEKGGVDEMMAGGQITLPRLEPARRQLR